MKRPVNNRMMGGNSKKGIRGDQFPKPPGISPYNPKIIGMPAKQPITFHRNGSDVLFRSGGSFWGRKYGSSKGRGNKYSPPNVGVGKKYNIRPTKRIR